MMTKRNRDLVSALPFSFFSSLFFRPSNIIDMERKRRKKDIIKGNKYGESFHSTLKPSSHILLILIWVLLLNSQFFIGPWTLSFFCVYNIITTYFFQIFAYLILNILLTYPCHSDKLAHTKRIFAKGSNPNALSTYAAFYAWWCIPLWWWDFMQKDILLVFFCIGSHFLFPHSSCSKVC